MLGLLYKYFVGTKRENILLLVVAGAVAVLTLAVGAPAMMPCVGGLMGVCVVAPAADLQLDKQSGWNRFICASPLPRGKVILSLYLCTMLSNCFFICLLLLINLIHGAFPYWLFPTLFALALLFQSITLPVGLRLGQTAATIVFMTIVFGAAAILSFLGKWGVLNEDSIDWAAHLFLQNPWLSAGLVLLIVVLLYALSCLFSCRIYKKMEF